MVRSVDPKKAKIARRPPATTIKSRENQMISLATDCAEQQLRNGTASSQVITHYLKLGTSLAELEKKKLEADTRLAEAKAESVASDKNNNELYQQVIDAISEYRPRSEGPDEI